MSFTIYPAIDLKNGEVVRLRQGNTDQPTVYGKDPVSIAKAFEKAGAKWLHVVDLDGAFAGRGENINAIKSIVSAVTIPVQTGGGIRTMESIKTMLNEIGVQRVILGTAAVKNIKLVKEAVRLFGHRIAVGIDAKNGMSTAEGWADTSEVAAIDTAKAVKKAGVELIIYTDISKDGMMKGPNIEQTKKIAQIGDVDVILSGGISSTQDILDVKAAGFAGVIAGKAIYEEAIDLQEVIKLC